MKQHYEGFLGNFEYDEEQFQVVDGYLRYVGKETDGSKIVVPEGVTSLAGTFANSGLVTPPVIPEGVVDCQSAFRECFQLKKAPNVPESVTDCTSMFYNCFRLKETAVCNPNENRVCKSMYCGCVSLESVDNLECSDLTVGKFLDCFNLKLSESQLVQLRTADLLDSKAFALTFPNCVELLENCFAAAFPFHSLITVGLAVAELGVGRQELIAKWIMPFVDYGVLPEFSVSYLISGIDEAYNYKEGHTISEQDLTDEMFEQQLEGYKFNQANEGGKQPESAEEITKNGAPQSTTGL